GDNIIPYRLYVTNALTTFFFISGYLFYKEESFNFQRKIKSIIRTIIIPYFIFTSVIAFPKMWIHENEIDISNIIQSIFLGHASWFVAALILAEIIFSIILYICKGKLGWLSILSIGCFISSIILANFKNNYPWQLSNALQAILFLYLGYLYHRYEYLINLKFYIIFPLWLFMKAFEEYFEMNLYINPITIDHYVVFLLDIILFNIWFIQLCKYIERKCNQQSSLLRMIAWTGKQSLIYYFLCGGVPLLVSMTMNKMNYAYEGHYYRVIIAFISVYLIASALTWLIVHYIPQITGKR
ncbi:MAG: acyltransferase, partial [Prevotella sp.]|nr:acyltransferase [Prevotella sp.]